MLIAKAIGKSASALRAEPVDLIVHLIGHREALVMGMPRGTGPAAMADLKRMYCIVVFF